MVSAAAALLGASLAVSAPCATGVPPAADDAERRTLPAETCAEATTGGDTLHENKNKISYFSWYSYTGCDEGRLPEPGCQRNMSASPGKAYRNLAMDGDLTFLRRNHDQFSVPGMLLLQNSEWHSGVFDGSPLKAGLAPGWEASVDDCIATLVRIAT